MLELCQIHSVTGRKPHIRYSTQERVQESYLGAVDMRFGRKWNKS